MDVCEIFCYLFDVWTFYILSYSDGLNTSVQIQRQVSPSIEHVKTSHTVLSPIALVTTNQKINQ